MSSAIHIKITGDATKEVQGHTACTPGIIGVWCLAGLALTTPHPTNVGFSPLLSQSLGEERGSKG